MGVSFYVRNFFSLAVFKIFSLSLILDSFIIMYAGEDPFGGLMSFMNLDFQIFPQIWEVLSHHFLKETFCPFLLLFCSETPIIVDCFSL